MSSPESAHQPQRLIEDLDWMHHGNEHDCEQEARSVEERIIDDVEGSVTLTASDDTPHPPLRNVTSCRKQSGVEIVSQTSRTTLGSERTRWRN
jgi:hypothetical protein